MDQLGRELVIDVTQFGAKGDGITDDTAAINAAYQAASYATEGPVYFPPSKGFYKVSTLQLPDMDYSRGWLVSLFDNGLYADQILPGNWNAFIGRTSNFAGLGGSFVWRNNAAWQQPKGVSAPLIDIKGKSQVVFQGINAQTQSANPAVNIEPNAGAGSTAITFDGCCLASASDTAKTPSFVARGAFNLHIKDSSLGNLFINMGFPTIAHCFLHSVYTQVGDLLIDDCLSEGLNNQPFLTVDTSGGPVTDITLRRVKMADTQGSSCMLKHINDIIQSLFPPAKPFPANWVVNVKFDMCPEGNIGAGYIDPSSAPNLLSVICEGSTASDVLNAKQCLYDAMLKGPKDKLYLYGSQYLNPPFEVIQN